MTNQGKIRLDKLSWFVPHVKPNLEYETKLLTQIRNTLRYEVAYKKLSDHNISIPPGNTFTWRLSTLSTTEKPRFIIVGFQIKKDLGEVDNKALFNHVNLENIFVNLNSRRYPEVDYNLDFEENKFSRMFKEAV